MDFGKVLTRSWEIIWNNKILWLFGILASCGAQNQFGSSFNYSYDSGSVEDLPRGMQEFFLNMERNFGNISVQEDTLILIAFALMCFFFILGLVLFLISIYGRVGLIKGAQDAAGGKSLQLSTLASDVRVYCGRALGLNILLVIIVLVLFVAVGLFFAGCAVLTFGIGAICLAPLLCLMLPLGLVYTVYLEFSNIALITEDLGVGDALKRGWQVMRENAVNVFVMALILFIGGAVVSFLIGLPFALIGLPALIGAFSETQSGFTTGLLTSLVGFVLALPAMLLVGGVLRSYLQSAWTLTYMQLTGKDV